MKKNVPQPKNVPERGKADPASRSGPATNAAGLAAPAGENQPPAAWPDQPAAAQAKTGHKSGKVKTDSSASLSQQTEPDSYYVSFEENSGPDLPLSAHTKKVKTRQKKGKYRWVKRILIGLAALLLVLAVGLVGLWNWLLSGAQTSLTVSSAQTSQTSSQSTTAAAASGSSTGTSAETAAATPTPTPDPDEAVIENAHYDKKITNILIIGTDSRDGESLTYALSDTMILLTIDQTEQQIKLTSFQRDMMVYMDGESEPQKLNEANLKGPEYLIQTINQNFDLNIDDYIMVNMIDAEKIVDALGGIDVDIPDDQEVLDYLNRLITEQNAIYEGWGEDRSGWVDTIKQGGYQHLNGRQAIAYARMRELDSDYKRMARQREVLYKVYQKARTEDALTLLKTVKTGFSIIRTDMSKTELTQMIFALLPTLNSDIQTLQIPLFGYYWADTDNSWNIHANFNALIPKLQQFIYGQLPSTFEPVSLLPYTPLQVTDQEYIPDGVKDGSSSIANTGASGWTTDGVPVTVTPDMGLEPDETSTLSFDSSETETTAAQ
ncbi:hypothetical protein HCH52_02320 [Oscillospiraceae bacterium HV4-5-C5C]|nr:hypothetical protein [Oscillospiraceae bacterium HV4-5-C5C]